MSKKSFWAIGLVLLLLPALVLAQTGVRIKGVVKDDLGEPLVGANVIVKGTYYGSATASDGSYLIRIPPEMALGQEVELTAQFIGYKSKTVKIKLVPGTIEQNFELTQDVLELESIVVTGAGGTQIKEKLGVTIAKVRAEEVVNAGDANIVSALSGKVANLEITKTSGDAGTNTYIRIRGAATIDRPTQPLFVVDGTPISNVTLYTNGFNGGTEAQNRAADLNLEDIESIEILKGAAASAIYGSRASNGVVLITTKSGKPGKTRISYKQVLGMTKQSKFYPLQTWFGQGTKGKFRKNYSRSWGRPLNVPGAPHYDPGAPIDTIYDHARELTDMGWTNENNITISGGNELTTFYISLGHLYEKGHWKAGSDYRRYSARLKASQVLSSKFKLTGNLAYANTKAHYLQRGDNAIGVGIASLRTPPEFNNWPYLHPVTGYHRSYRYSDAKELRASRKFDNPFFILYEHDNPATMNRVYGNVKLEYNLLDWVKLDYTLGSDYWTDARAEIVPISSSREDGVGRIKKVDFLYHELDGNLVLTVQGDKLLKNYKNINATLMLGHNLNSRSFRRFDVTGIDMGIPGFNQLDNTISTNLRADEYEYLIHTESFFGQLTVDLFDQLYLTGAFRNEGSSTFGKSQKRHWYPKASAAWEFTKFKKLPYIDYGKLRVAYGEAGVQPGVYTTISGFNSGVKSTGWSGILNMTYQGLKGYYTSGNLGNDNVKPERTKEFEIGTFLGFYNNRIGLDITYYYDKSTDVLFDLNVVPSTGFFSQTANAAVIENKGLEITLDLNPIRTRNFNWDISINYARNRNMVLEMAGITAEDIKKDPSKEIWEQVGRWAYASPGHPLGEMRLQSWVRFGYGLKVEENGQLVDIDEKYKGQWKKGDVYIAEDGYPIMHTDRLWSGFDPNPDWTGGIRNEFRLFRNLTITTLLDFKQGFEIMNHTKGALYSYGTHKDTEVRGQVGPINRWFKHGEKAIGPGATNGVGKDIVYDEKFFRGIASGFSGDGWLFTEDASYVKLREISVSYTFRNQFLRNFGLSDVRVILSGRNLYTWTDYTGYDPESNRRQATNQRDSDYFNQPQTRSFFMTIYFNY
ncbi:MAG: SusC/RagA family TonB-linked outer membrane protein [candidate division KSB1 bacterium]|nr:SusC/RagA family TonB-linked outer membrane protein [candidate division KSB1 bacterium]